MWPCRFSACLYRDRGRGLYLCFLWCFLCLSLSLSWSLSLSLSCAAKFCVVGTALPCAKSEPDESSTQRAINIRMFFFILPLCFLDFFRGTLEHVVREYQIQREL